jgi:hypothetical protein
VGSGTTSSMLTIFRLSSVFDSTWIMLGSENATGRVLRELVLARGTKGSGSLFQRPRSADTLKNVPRISPSRKSHFESRPPSHESRFGLKYSDRVFILEDITESTTEPSSERSEVS